MKAIILCGGYGTRLYPLTSFIAKPLLPVCGKPVLNYIIDKLDKLKEVSEIFITTNRKFHNQFEKWIMYNKKDYKTKISLYKSSYLFKEKKLGGVDAIDKIIKTRRIKEDVLVIAGDNIFSYILKGPIAFFKEKKASVIVLSRLSSKEKAKKFGIVCIDKNNKIVEFQEKPKMPKSNLISTAIYFFPRQDLDVIKKYNNSKHKGDSIGNFLKYLCKVEEVYGFVPDGGFIDIGSLKDYKRANKICERW